MEKKQSSRRYSPEERANAVKLSEKIGPARASKELGIPDGTICNWRYLAKKAPAVAPVATEKPAERKAERGKKKVAKFYSPSLKAQVLEYVAQHGISEASRKFSVTRFAIYDWQRKVKLHADGKAKVSPVVGADENPAAIRDQRIVAEWKSSAGLGPSQVRNQLRRQGMKVSIHTVRCVLEQHGYVTPKVRREEGHDKRFEAVRPNQLWHLDFLHRHINKQKIYVPVILDDFSRFIVGAAIWDGERVGSVIDTFESSVARHGRPEKVLSDGGSAFHSWRGVGRFTSLLTELEIDQIIAENPETNGKLEALNGNIRSEFFDQERFFDLAETQRRFLGWVNFYNLRRTHHGLGGLLVPGDRYFGRVEEVMACIESRQPPGAVGEPAPVGERQLDLFRISSHRGQVEVHLLGQRLVLPISR